jgi:hypothetical protein
MLQRTYTGLPGIWIAGLAEAVIPNGESMDGSSGEGVGTERSSSGVGVAVGSTGVGVSVPGGGYGALVAAVAVGASPVSLGADSVGVAVAAMVTVAVGVGVGRLSLRGACTDRLLSKRLRMARVWIQVFMLSPSCGVTSFPIWIVKRIILSGSDPDKEIMGSFLGIIIRVLAPGRSILFHI